MDLPRKRESFEEQDLYMDLTSGEAWDTSTKIRRKREIPRKSMYRIH